MVMEKQEKLECAFHFPITAAAVGIYVLKIEWVRLGSRAFFGG
jgi:hypothetical protein